MIVVDMVRDLRQKQVEVWTIAKADGPAYSGKLTRIVVGPRPGAPADEERIDGDSPVAWLGLLDERGLDIRVVGDAVVAVVARG